MKKYLLYTLLIILTCNLIIGNLYASENEKNRKKAKDFFDKEFVTQKQKKTNRGFVEFDEKNDIVTPTPAIKMEMFPKEKKVLYINLIVSGDDLEHFNKYREYAENFTIDRKIQFKKMYITCNNCDKVAIYNSLNTFVNWILGRNYIICDTLPIKYSSITKSPTFVVAIEKGEIILEGTNLLEKYINETGYYLGKTDYSDLTKTPTITSTLTSTPTTTPTRSISDDNDSISEFGF